MRVGKLLVFKLNSILIITAVQNSFSQATLYNADIDELHFKYMELRKSLVNDFTLGIGGDQGQSIPCSGRFIREQDLKISWGDSPGHLGYYIGMLAMEYELLSRNNQPTERIVRELFWALNAFNRLDTLAENYFYYPSGYGNSGMLNGFSLRNDVDSITDQQYDELNRNPELFPVKNFNSGFHNKLQPGQDRHHVTISQDHLSYMFTGLALVRKLIPESVVYLENGIPKNFPITAPNWPANSSISIEAKNIINRFIHYMHFPPWEWKIVNPIDGTISEPQGGNAFTLSVGFYHSHTATTNSPPVINQNQVILNLKYRLANALWKRVLSGDIVTEYVRASSELRMFLNLLAVSGYHNNAFSTLNDLYMDNDTTFSGTLTIGTDQIIPIIDQILNIDTTITIKVADNGDHDYDYIPGVHKILYPNASSSNFDISQYPNDLLSLLKCMNCEMGPFNHDIDLYSYGLALDTAVAPAGYGAFEWSSSGRLIEPQERGKSGTLPGSHSYGDYNGIDWMFFYNLYCLLSNNHAQYSDFYFMEKRPDTVFANEQVGWSWEGEKAVFYDMTVKHNGMLFIGINSSSQNPMIVKYVDKECDNDNNHIHLEPGGQLYVGSTNHPAHLIFEEGTGLIIEGGALDLRGNSTITFKKGSSLLIRENSDVYLKLNCQIYLEEGAYFCIEDNVGLDFANNAFIHVADGVLPFYLPPYFPQYITSDCVNPDDYNDYDTPNIDIIVECTNWIPNYNVIGNTHFDDPPSIYPAIHSWNNDSTVNDTIFIHANNTLILNDCHLEFTPKGAILIDRDGWLIVNNSTLSGVDDCPNAMWNGIFVSGNSLAPQEVGTQFGHCIIKNNSMIRDAIVGIQTADNYFPHTDPAGTINTGGIIKAKNSSFKNNITAISINEYENFDAITGDKKPNESVFEECQFITDNIIKDYLTPYPETFISLHYAEKIKLFGNLFENTLIDPNGENFRHKGKGISAVHSTMIVKDKCLYYNQNGNCYGTRNEFKNLEYGIKHKWTSVKPRPGATLLGGHGGTEITHCIFNNCYRGVYLQNTRNDVILSNDFYIPQSAPNYAIRHPQAYGLYLDYTSGYHVEGNKFSYNPFIAPATNTDNFGLIVNNSFDPLNMIYNNEFEDLNTAINAQNNNRSIPFQEQFTGLKINCNDISNSQYDIVVTENVEEGMIAGISKYQGYNNSQSAPAGNTFSFIASTEGDYANSDLMDNDPNGQMAFVIYYHHNVDQVNHCDPSYNWRPCYFEPLAVQMDNVLHPYLKEFACPSGIPSDNPNITNLVAGLPQQLTTIESSKLLLSITLDGGNTEGLEDIVELAMPWESYQVYGQLIAESPDLSEDVMTAAAENEDVLSNQMIKILMISNPHCISSPEVWEAINARNNPMPEYMVTEIFNNIDNPSPIASLEAEIAFLNMNFHNDINKIKRIILSDSTGTFDEDSLEYYYEFPGDLTNKWEYAFIKAANTSADGGLSYLNTLSTTETFSEEELVIHGQYLTIMSILDDIESAEGVAVLTGTQLNDLQSIFNSSKHLSSGIAIALLESYDEGFMYEEPILEPSTAQLRFGNFQQPNVENRLVAFPNPANQVFNIEYSIEEPFSTAEIRIFDVMGKEINKASLEENSNTLLIDCNHYPTGLYLIQLVADNRILISLKINVN